MDANEAIKRLAQAAEKTAQSAQEHIDRGTHPEAVGFHLANVASDLPEAVKLAQVEYLVDGLSDEAIAELERQLAVAKSQRQKDNGDQPKT